MTLSLNGIHMQVVLSIASFSSGIGESEVVKIDYTFLIGDGNNSGACRDIQDEQTYFCFLRQCHQGMATLNILYV